ncbi:hypothetical protein [Polaromonas sp.]|uniref:hypothetical protein n=1 Tax=Polaromonas sp. TaxID=1869339 RepID=UPI003BAB5DCF
MAIDGKGGRPRTHWADQARVTYWYARVREATGWSDYRLDSEFAMVAKAPGENRSTNRPRVFEKIRKSNVVPSRGLHWRKPIDLVALVAQRAGLQHTRVAYESEFWNLLKAPPSLRDTHAQLLRLMTSLGLTRIDPFKLKSALELAPDLSDASCFIRGLEQSLNGIGWLDRLSLLALLTREADLAGNTEITKLTRSFFDEHLDLFFNRFFPANVASHYYDSALSNYCFGDRNVAVSEMGLRRRLEAECGKSIMSIR